MPLVARHGAERVAAVGEEVLGYPVQWIHRGSECLRVAECFGDDQSTAEVKELDYGI